MLGFFVCRSIVNTLMIDPARSLFDLVGINIKNKELQISIIERITLFIYI